MEFGPKDFVGNDYFQFVSVAVQASGHLKNFMPLIHSGTENNVAYIVKKECSQNSRFCHRPQINQLS